jgi:hypothetical protein
MNNTTGVKSKGERTKSSGTRNNPKSHKDDMPVSDAAVFCILKYRIWLSPADYESVEYERLALSQDGYEYSSTIISAKKAKETIEAYNMREKINNEWGRVWEIPRKSFRRRYRGN